MNIQTGIMKLGVRLQQQLIERVGVHMVWVVIHRPSQRTPYPKGNMENKTETQ